MLQHHKDTTVVLYAIDFNPKELIKRFVDSQSDATRLAVEDVEDLVEDWVKFIDNKNIGKSPFFVFSGAVGKNKISYNVLPALRRAGIRITKF